jgi:hypothetical protein
MKMSAAAPVTIVRGTQTIIAAPRITIAFSRDTSSLSDVKLAP